MKTARKLLAILLTVLTVMSAFSVATPVIAANVQSAYAEEIVPADEDSVAEAEAIEAEAENTEPVVIGEDESRRTADTKHFIMSDGSRKAVIYGNAVHYADSNGKWQEIDNTLTYDSEKKEYRNKQNSFKATFKEDFGEENLFSLENEGYTISWEYEANVLRKAITKTEYKNKEKPDDKVMQCAAQSEDKITYKGFESDCELEYVVTDNGVKENIILNSKTNKNEFTFKVTAEGLTLSKNQDGSISAKNAEGEEIFFIPAPFMYDSNNVYSYDVSYEIESKKDSYTITVVADKDWLKADERVYPVTIDPVIYTKQTSTSVSSTFVTEDLPTANYGSRQDIYIGDESANYGQCYAMFTNTLPTLNKGDMVVGAALNLYLYNTSFDGGSSERQLDAHIITSSWAENSVTWNTKPTYNSIITDYCFMNSGDNDWKSFDITKAVKGWYEGTFTNYGILIKTHDETLAPARAIFRSENATSITEGIPYIAIAYRNNKGVESYWSYSSFSNGVGGTASVNDYTGNLVYTVPLASSVSEILPVSLSLVYNAYCSSETYTAGKSSSNLMSAGKGWRLNYQHTLLPSSNYGLTGDDATNYPYVYTDGDGTEHYIAKTKDDDGNIVYKDEDGLGYTYTRPGTSIAEYKLAQDDGSFMYFNAQGNLTHIYDNSGNRILLTYDSTGKKLQKITDGTGHTFTFTYTSGTDYLYSITDNASRVTRLVIESGVLKGVIFNDTTSKTYMRYKTGDENLLDYVWCNDKNGLAFDYTTRAKASRVSKVTEFSATGSDVAASTRTIGSITTFDRSLYNTTTIRTPGVDGIHNTTNSDNGSDDIISTLQFDNFGRTVSQQVKYGNGSSVGAGTYTYTGDDEVESRNKINSSATLNKNTVNLINNNSFETTGSWSVIANGGLTGSYAYSTDTAYYGKKSLKLTSTAVTSLGRNFAQQSFTNLTKGYNYTFSAYVKVTSLTLQESINDTLGFYLRMSAYDANGTYLSSTYSSIITKPTDSNINNGWRRLFVTMQVPTNSASISVFAILGSSLGTVYIDGAQLEEGYVANSVNLLQNGSFEQYSSTAITTWTPSSGVTYTANTYGISTANVRNGSAALKITGGGEDYIGFYQYVSVAPNEDDTYILSGWAAAYAVNNTYHSNSKFELAARVSYSVSDGTTTTQYKDSAEFNTTVSNWQYASTAFSLKYKKADETDTKTYTPTYIMVMPRYNLQANYAYFDHIQLIKDVASSYIYDSEGNVTSVSANAEQKNNMTYEGDDLKTYTDAAGYKSEYTYDSNHRLTQAKSAKGVKVNYTYNGRGQVTSVENVNVGGAAKTKTTNTYTGAYSDHGLTSGAYLYRTTNELGKTTTYGHNLPTGAQTSVTDANNNATYYYYDDNYTKLLKTESNGTSVSYTYNGNRISQILFNGGNNKQETYSFGYDSFGNVTSTSVGSKSLVTNTYGSNNGLLQKSAYANGDAIRYGYNNSGLVSQIFVDNNAISANPSFTWNYSSNGLPRAHKDGITGYKYDYSYDSIGRLIRTNISKSSDSSYVASTEYGYDVRNNLTSIVNDIGGNAYKQIYGYYNTGVGNAAEDTKDNLPTRYIVLGVNTDYTYDSLNKLTKKTVDTTTDIVNQYYYNTLNDENDEIINYTSQLRCEIINGISYHYEYDDVGNITAIKKGTSADDENPSEYRAYSYDNKYQLESETIGSTINQWTYDGLGNIETKTTTVNGTSTGKITYTYGADSSCGWNNLLTQLTISDYTNNTTTTETIDYDAIGNPLTYRGATLNWYGRQLKTFIKNGTTIAMTYDADGLRSTKQISGVKTEYQYVGDKLFYENRGNGDSFYYFYDSYGKLAALYHHRNGTKVAYHVVTNAQGDVIALYSWAGALVASYEYDAWGNCTIVSDTSSTGIATLNPFRYRGYYYDTDLGLYYLQSRYYDAEIGRFINSDNVTDPDAGLTGYNTYVYCGNNPVNAADPTGHFVVSAFLTKVVTGALVGGIIGGVSNLATQLIKNDWDFSKVNPTEVAIAAGVGAVTGALSGGLGFLASKITNTVANVAVQIVSGGVTNVVGDTLDKAIHGEEITSMGMVDSFAQGCVSAFTCLSIQAVVKGINTRQFNQMKKSDQRLALRSVNDGKNVTNKMMGSGPYVNDYLSRYNESVGAVNDFGWSLYVELFVE